MNLNFNRSFIIILGLSLSLFACKIFTDKENSKQKPNVSQLMLELTSDKKFVSTDQLADWLINQDPSIQLIDVRDAEWAKKFTLRNAVNVPFVELNSDRAKSLLDCNKRQHIFYSNNDLLAEQAWFIHRLSGCKEALILKGGLNAWVENIFHFQAPEETASQEEFDLYSFRKAARLYFIGESRELAIEKFQAPEPKKTVVLKPKPVVKEEEEEEGC